MSACLVMVCLLTALGLDEERREPVVYLYSSKSSAVCWDKLTFDAAHLGEITEGFRDNLGRREGGGRLEA